MIWHSIATSSRRLLVTVAVSGVRSLLSGTMGFRITCSTLYGSYVTGHKTTVQCHTKPRANFDVVTFPRFYVVITMVDSLHNDMYPISSFWRLDTLSSGSQGLSLSKVISGELNLAHLCKIAITILVLCLALIRKSSDHTNTQHNHKMRQTMSPLPGPAALPSRSSWQPSQ